MKSLILAFIMLISSASMALESGYGKYVDQEMKFQFLSNNSYYSCSYAEKQTEKYLIMLGAKDIEIRCTGGIQSGSPSWAWAPISVRASFQALVTVDNSEKDAVPVEENSVTFKGRGSCDFNSKLIKNALSHFEAIIEGGFSNCFNSNGSYSYDVITLKTL